MRAYRRLSVWLDTQLCGSLTLAIKGLSHPYFCNILTNSGVLQFLLLALSITLSQQRWCNHKIFFSSLYVLHPVWIHQMRRNKEDWKRNDRKNTWICTWTYVKKYNLDYQFSDWFNIVQPFHLGLLISTLLISNIWNASDTDSNAGFGISNTTEMGHHYFPAVYQIPVHKYQVCINSKQLVFDNILRRLLVYSF